MRRAFVLVGRKRRFGLRSEQSSLPIHQQKADFGRAL